MPDTVTQVNQSPSNAAECIPSKLTRPIKGSEFHSLHSLNDVTKLRGHAWNNLLDWNQQLLLELRNGNGSTLQNHEREVESCELWHTYHQLCNLRAFLDTRPRAYAMDTRCLFVDLTKRPAVMETEFKGGA